MGAALLLATVLVLWGGDEPPKCKGLGEVTVKQDFKTRPAQAVVLEALARLAQEEAAKRGATHLYEIRVIQPKACRESYRMKAVALKCEVGERRSDPADVAE